MLLVSGLAKLSFKIFNFFETAARVDTPNLLEMNDDDKGVADSARSATSPGEEVIVEIDVSELVGDDAYEDEITTEGGKSIVASEEAEETTIGVFGVSATKNEVEDDEATATGGR